MNLFVRWAADDLHPLQIAFFRCVFAVALLAPWVIKHKSGFIAPAKRKTFLLLAVCQTFATLSWFVAVSLIPLVEATALSFTTPFFATILAASFLGEIVRIRRWTAIIVGFSGAMIVLRPGFQEFHSAALLVFLCAVFAASYGVIVRHLSAGFSPIAIVVYNFVLMTPMTLIPALFVWQTPSWGALASVFGVAVIGTLGHVFLARAWSSAEVSVVAPFDYVQLVFAAIIGFVFFAERPDVWTWVGAAVIIGSAFYIARREAYLHRVHDVAVAADEPPRQPGTKP
jgi:drug/metabolite transporter (DMT)-like permease